MSEEMTWRDDPLTTAEQDTLGTAHVARRMARLIEETHSFESSTVVGLAGPWGSGKSSVVAMCLEELKRRDTGWAVGAFTPWATTDSAGMMADFYATLTTALPEQQAGKLREGLGVLARVGAPALKLIPYVGDLAAEAVDLAADKMLKQPSWDKAFRDVSVTLRQMATPVLIVVDDVDRLQQGELLNLLKVIRLLGRFPGVSYLLAYDEQTLFRNLKKADVGTGAREGARLYLEKIVQHPVAMPPMLESQVLQRVSDGIDELLAVLGRPAIESDSRLNRVTDSLVAQLSTPRAISRYLAQVQLVLSMHDAGEINDVDVILMTFVRVQFPDLYSELRRWRPELTGGRSDRQVMKNLGKQGSGQTADFAALWSVLPKGPTREDAQEVMAQLFPATSKYQVSARAQLRASDRDYFDRYFIHSIPSDDVPDATLRAALDEAGTAGAGVNHLRALLKDQTPAQASVVTRRLRLVFEASPHESVDPLSLLGGILEVLDDAPNTDAVLLVDARRRLTYWASHLIAQLPESVPVEGLEAALSRCTTPDGVLTVLWGTREEQALSPVLPEMVRRYAEQCLLDVIEHLQEGDAASLEMPCHFKLVFIAEFGDAKCAKAQMVCLLGQGVTAEALASRCVTVGHWVGVAAPQGMVRAFDQETFASFAPDDDALYQTEIEKVLEIARIGQGLRVGLVSQRCVDQAARMSLRVMITALASAMKASMTRVRRSVQMASFVKPRLCHELVRSTTQRAPA